MLFNKYSEQVLERWHNKCSGIGLITDDITAYSLLFADGQITFTKKGECGSLLKRADQKADKNTTKNG